MTLGRKLRNSILTNEERAPTRGKDASRNADRARAALRVALMPTTERGPLGAVVAQRHVSATLLIDAAP